MEAVKEALRNGEDKAWTDQVVDGIGVASKGCVCLACAFEIERDGSVFLCMVNRESRGVLEYAGVNVSELRWDVCEFTSISTLELSWNTCPGET